jgi:sulfonate transport system permease protein
MNVNVKDRNLISRHRIGMTMTPRLRAVAVRTVLPIALLILWETAVHTGWWPRTIIAPPSEVAWDFFYLLLDGTLVVHAAVSVKRLVLGFLCGLTLAIALGGAIGVFRTVERAVGPTIQILAPVPVIAWIPLLIILFGINGSRVALIATGTFFIMVFATIRGIRSVDVKLIEVARVFEKSHFELFRQVLLPSALPNILDSCRMALAIGWILLLAGEVIASSSGLGWLIWNSRNFSRADDMIVGMIAVGLLGGLTDWGMSRLQSWYLRWRPTYQGQ